MGLSSDPEKRRRQLAGLAKGAEARAARLRAQLAELEPAASEARSEAPAAPVSEAASEAPQGARIVRGSYGDLPATPAPAEPADELEDDLDPEPEPEEERQPSGLARLAAAALGVKP